MKKLVLVFSILILLFSSTFIVASETNTDYILPYPSFMPGNKLYKLKEIKDDLIGFFMFGNFTKFSYHLKRADKYLVEAKTLFEYGQTELSSKALEKYQQHMQVLPKLLTAAQKEGKNISQKEELLQRAIVKHQQILSRLETTK